MSPTIIRPAIQAQFDRFVQNGRVFFISAPCGFGKTVLAEALLADQDVCRLSADDSSFTLPAELTRRFLLLDDAQQLSDEDWQALCSLIRSNSERRFVLLSRGAPPGCLMAFQYAGLMTVLTPDMLLFDRDDIRRLFSASGTPVTESELTSIRKESIGHPLGVPSPRA